MTFIYQYRKLGPVDDYLIRKEGEPASPLNDFTQAIEILGTAIFLGKTVERIDFESEHLTVWKIK